VLRFAVAFMVASVLAPVGAQGQTAVPPPATPIDAPSHPTLPSRRPLPPAFTVGSESPAAYAAAAMRCPGTAEGIAAGAVGGALVGWIFSYGLIALSGSTGEPVQRGRRLMIAGGAVLGAVRGGVAAARCDDGAGRR
jgi:hypothetical protein